jgi:hypothetical protein
MSARRNAPIVAAAALGALVIAAAPTAHAAPVGVTLPGGACLPPSDPNDGYVSQFHAHYATGGPVFDLSNVIHNQFTQCFTPPNSGTSTEAFNSTVSFDLSVNGGALQHITTSGVPVSVNVTFAGTVASTTTYNTEMTQLDINLGGGVLVRESPTLASTGQTTVTDNGGGHFHIDSFFDIFTELSLDNGATWTPSTSQSGGTTPVATHGYRI